MFLFLSGPEMEPERLRSAWPQARFVARARLQPRPLGTVMPPAGTRFEVWGIIVETPDAPVAGGARAAITDDGRAFTVTAPTAGDADPAALLAAARYWELPPPYVRRLAIAAGAPVEEYVY